MANTKEDVLGMTVATFVATYRLGSYYKGFLAQVAMPVLLQEGTETPLLTELCDLSEQLDNHKIEGWHAVKAARKARDRLALQLAAVATMRSALSGFTMDAKEFATHCKALATTLRTIGFSANEYPYLRVIGSRIDELMRMEKEQLLALEICSLGTMNTNVAESCSIEYHTSVKNYTNDDWRRLNYNTPELTVRELLQLSTTARFRRHCRTSIEKTRWLLRKLGFGDEYPFLRDWQPSTAARFERKALLDLLVQDTGITETEAELVIGVIKKQKWLPKFLA